MAKIKWKNKTDIDAEKAMHEQQKLEREKFKDKTFNTLSRVEKDVLLELLLREHDLI